MLEEKGLKPVLYLRYIWYFHMGSRRRKIKRVHQINEWGTPNCQIHWVEYSKEIENFLDTLVKTDKILKTIHRSVHKRYRYDYI